MVIHDARSAPRLRVAPRAGGRPGIRLGFTHGPFHTAGVTGLGRDVPGTPFEGVDGALGSAMATLTEVAGGGHLTDEDSTVDGT